MRKPSFCRFAASVLAVFLSAALAPMIAAQDEPSGMPAGALPEHPADPKIDPELVLDGQHLAASGFVAEGDHVRHDLRVVIEIAQHAGDVTFETSAALDPVADVQTSVARRQAFFLQALDGALTPAERAEVRILFPLELQYMLAAEVVDLDTLRALAAAPGVKHIWKDNLNKLLTNEGRALTGSTAAAAAGNTGAGVGVAVIDTNFDLLHPELGGSTMLPNTIVKGGYNFSSPGLNTGIGPAIHSQTWADCRHGTSTASIVRRYAPGCHLYLLVVFPNSFDSVIANAINWCVISKHGRDGAAPIKVISMSLGGGRHYSAVTSGTLHTACGTAVSNGILCFAASGNDGWTDSMASPAASTNCISVGATWDINNAPYTPFAPANCSHPNRLVDERTCYSDTASFLSIYCPSEEVTCARCGGGTLPFIGYQPFGGTSAATPAAAGLTAQLLQARPNYAGDLSGLVSLYQNTGVPVTGDPGKRRINLTGALAGAAGVTGRRMNLLAPPVIGQTATFSMTYPVSAAGNSYAFLFSAPFGGVVPVVVPGFTVNGFARVDPIGFVIAFSGQLGPAGSVTHGIAVPNDPSLIGYALDLQAVDVDVAATAVFLSDNELALSVSNTITNPTIPANMAPIAAGSFQMGSNAAPGLPYFSQANERPVHQVTISQPFWMGRYEVTQAEYQAVYLPVIVSNPSYFQGASYPNSASRPVELVTWYDAMAYCAALTTQETAAGRVPPGYHYRLPTEAEWEYCCRAGTTTEFHYGNSLVCGQARFYYSNTTNSSCNSSSTVAVGSYAANAWGLHDMHGNAEDSFCSGRRRSDDGRLPGGEAIAGRIG